MTVKDLKKELNKIDENLEVIVKDRCTDGIFGDGFGFDDSSVLLITDKQNHDNTIATKLYL